MLDEVRKPWRAKNIFAYVLFGFICFIFVFVGIVPDHNNGITGSGTAAIVNDVVIPVSDFQERVSMIESQMGQAFNGLPAAQRQARTKMLRENALEELVNYELVYQSAEQAGVLPTVAGTRDFVVGIPAFQQEGRFARELYDNYLAYKRYTPADFESRVQRDVVIGLTRELFTTAFQQPKALDQLDRVAKDTKINLEFVKIDEAALGQSDLVTASDVAAFLAKDENKARIKSEYENRKSEFTSEAEVRARHILLKGDSDAILKRAKDLREQAIKGDFAQLATQNSEDEGSKTRGGDLNFFKRGQMVKEFEDAAFGLAIGQVSEPVKTSYGYHIIKVEERRGGETKSLETVQNDLAKKILTDEAKEKLYTQIGEDLKGKKSVAPWISRLKLKWEETGEFSLNAYSVPKIEAGEEVLTAALNIKSVGETHTSLIRTGPTAYIVKLKKRDSPQGTSDSTAVTFSNAGGEALGLWAEHLKKEARIRKNNVLLN